MFHQSVYNYGNSIYQLHVGVFYNNKILFYFGSNFFSFVIQQRSSFAFNKVRNHMQFDQLRKEALFKFFMILKKTVGLLWNSVTKLIQLSILLFRKRQYWEDFTYVLGLFPSFMVEHCFRCAIISKRSRCNNRK